MCDPVVAQIVSLMEQERSLILECQEVDCSSIIFSVACSRLDQILRRRAYGGNQSRIAGVLIEGRLCMLDQGGYGTISRPFAIHEVVRPDIFKRPAHSRRARLSLCFVRLSLLLLLRMRCRRDCELVTPQQIELPISVFPRSK